MNSAKRKGQKGAIKVPNSLIMFLSDSRSTENNVITSNIPTIGSVILEKYFAAPTIGEL